MNTTYFDCSFCEYSVFKCFVALSYRRMKLLKMSICLIYVLRLILLVVNPSVYFESSNLEVCR